MSLNIINPFQKFASGGAIIPFYQELGRYTASGTTDTLDVSSFASKPYLMILDHAIPSGVCSDKMTYNGVSSSDYATRDSGNGGGDGTNAPNPNITLNYTSDDNQRFVVGFMDNPADYEKLGVFWTNQASGTASDDIPNRTEVAGKYAETSNRITRITDTNDKAGDFDTGSELVVLGYDPANDTSDQSNFWELLASDGGAKEELTSGTLTAKKYYFVMFGQYSNVQCRIRLNDDSSANYCLRRNEDGTERTEVDQNEWRTWNNGSAVGRQVAMFIVNVASQTKLMQYWVNESSATGNNNINSMEGAGMWDNASDAVTKISFDSDGGTLDSNSFLQVWGAN